ncbi:MAG TPA: murein biosynthesis integral membrane protein MurJ [Jatrophihabitantaceae bacterium]
MTDDVRDPAEDEWSEPSHYGRGLITFEPRMFTEDPSMTGVFMPLWQHASEEEWEHAEETWSSTTYAGRRKHRPDTTTKAPSTPTERGGLLASSRTMAIASLASRVSGFLRSVVLAAAIGTGLVGDAYNGANTFPNQVYELLVGGVLSSVLIPLLVHAEEHDEDRGEAYTQRLLSIATAVLGAATVVAVAAAPLLAAAFVNNHSERQLTTAFATLLLPEIFFYGLGAMFTAILNIRNVYGPGAWAPVLNNVITILAVGVFALVPGPKTLVPANMTNTQILVLGVGTTLGIAAQALVLLPALRRTGFRWKWRFRAERHERGMGEAGALTGWVVGYVVASQIGVSVIVKVGFNHNGVANFTYADLLFQVPYGILGVSLLTALMPRMSRAAARGDRDGVIEHLNLGARLSAVALVPVTIGLMVLGPSFTLSIFVGKVSQHDARLIGTSLALSAFGLLPFALVMLQMRVFYAMRDARTPTIINIGMVAVKIVLVLIAAETLHGDHVVEALNIATSACYVVGAIVGHQLLARRYGRLGFSRVIRTIVRIGVASVLGGAAAVGMVLLGTSIAGHGRTGALIGVVGGAIAGLIVLVIAAWRMRIPEVREILAAARR